MTVTKRDGAYIETYDCGPFTLERWHTNKTDPRIRLAVDGRAAIEFRTSRLEDLVELLEHVRVGKPLHDNGWRDIAADALREGRIDEALKLIYENPWNGLVIPVFATHRAISDGAEFTITNRGPRAVEVRVLTRVCGP